MAVSTITPIRPAAPQGKASPRKTRRATRATLLRRHAPAIGLGAVIMVLLTLSLDHLAHGVQIVTNCAPWEAYAMAVGLDLLIVGLEVAMVSTAGTKAYKAVARFANPALIAAFVWSAGLNAFAFSAAAATVYMLITAASLGASIPTLIYLGTRAWAALAINARTA
jgi:hypothetical protein